jgi:hypothetical protein
VFLGVYPKPILDRINPSVERLIDHVEQRTGEHQPAFAEGGAGSTDPHKVGE